MDENNNSNQQSGSGNQGSQGEQTGNSRSQQGASNQGSQGNQQTGESFLRGPLRDRLSTKSGNIPSEKK